MNVTALQQLPDLTLGVIYVVAQVDRSRDGTTLALLEKTRVSRRLLLKSTEALRLRSVDGRFAYAWISL